MIELLTLTGIDERMPRKGALRMGAAAARVELAVLAGSATGTLPRFPNLNWIREWAREARENGVRTAIHLCGRLARGAGDADTEGVIELCRPFGRVQVNLPAGDRARRSDAIRRFADKVGRPVIVQHDGPWNESPLATTTGIELLFDTSGGRGIGRMEQWPAPPADRRVGYAGGIGAETIDEALDFAAAHADARLWLDMESGVRTDDWFDIEKAEKVIEAVERRGWRKK